MWCHADAALLAIENLLASGAVAPPHGDGAVDGLALDGASAYVQACCAGRDQSARRRTGLVSLRELAANNEDDSTLLAPHEALMWRCLCQWLRSDAINRGLAAAATGGARAAVQAATAAERHEVRTYALYNGVHRAKHRHCACAHRVHSARTLYSFSAAAMMLYTARAAAMMLYTAESAALAGSPPPGARACSPRCCKGLAAAPAAPRPCWTSCALCRHSACNDRSGLRGARPWQHLLCCAFTFTQTWMHAFVYMCTQHHRMLQCQRCHQLSALTTSTLPHSLTHTHHRTGLM